MPPSDFSVTAVTGMLEALETARVNVIGSFRL